MYLILRLVGNRHGWLFKTVGCLIQEAIIKCLTVHCFSFYGKMFLSATKILLGPVRSNKGSFIGYSMDGMPVYSFTREALQQTSQSLVIHFKHALKQVLDDTDSRKIFYFLCINLVSFENKFKLKKPTS